MQLSQGEPFDIVFMFCYYTATIRQAGFLKQTFISHTTVIVLHHLISYAVAGENLKRIQGKFLKNYKSLRYLK